MKILIKRLLSKGTAGGNGGGKKQEPRASKKTPWPSGYAHMIKPSKQPQKAISAIRKSTGAL